MSGESKGRPGAQTHSILVIVLTWPSNDLIGARVSKSHISTAPVGRAAATNRPEGSNLASEAPAYSEVWTAVGWEMVKKGSKFFSQRAACRLTLTHLSRIRSQLSDGFGETKRITLVREISFIFDF